MAWTDFVQRLVMVANAEHKSFAGVPETDLRLRTRIYETYLRDLRSEDPNNSIGWDVPANVSGWAWSSVFVSWCMLAAGADRTDFALSIRHAVYVKKGIENEQGGTGVFRARPIDQHAPAVGDVIVANRSGGKVSYAQAATRDEYPSHGAIVVDLIEREGKRFAITIGGNESDSIRRTEVALTSSGLIKQRLVNPYICVVATLKESPSVTALPFRQSHLIALGDSLSPAFRKHGTFVYKLSQTIAKYGSLDLFTAALQRAQMDHVWLHVHGTKPYPVAEKKAIREAVSALKEAGIAVAGWGWCQGATPIADAKMALKELHDFGIADYIADIEPEHNDSNWTASEIKDFCKTIRSGLSGSFAVSSFALIDWHEPHLLAAALPYVDAVAPQVYWFHFPNAKMQSQFKRPDGSSYIVGSPAQYADLCLDRWRRLMGNAEKPIILTGQAYWNEGGFDQVDAEAKLSSFLKDWNGYSQVCGINWWHFGGGGAMSHAMFEGIVAAQLRGRPYA